MTETRNLAPIIIKKKKVIAGGGHHGGAWKVAYADFVTAMMAFFMLMWLLNATTEKQRKGIADYFNPTIPVNRISGGGEGTGPSFVRGVAVQIAQALPNGTDRSVEITLDPIELGKVRLTLNMTNSGMAVQVLADRPETLELMRKNSDALIAEFREMGYADVGFEFTQNHDGTPAEDQTQPRVWAVPSGVLHQIEGPDLPSGARQLGQVDQLDLRL